MLAIVSASKHKNRRDEKCDHVTRYVTIALLEDVIFKPDDSADQSYRFLIILLEKKHKQTNKQTNSTGL